MNIIIIIKECIKLLLLNVEYYTRYRNLNENISA